MRSITFIRHAHASGGPFSKADFDRPLSQLGIDEANLMGNILVEKQINFDQIISSSANRAISTARIIKKQISFTDKIIPKKNIYGASSADLIYLIEDLNDNINSVALVGHNPTFHLISEQLSGKQFSKYPTCSIAKINFDIESWMMLSAGKLEYFLFPELYQS